MRSRAFGVTALVGASFFVASLSLLHAIRADVDWTRHYVSDFANGPLGWLFILGTSAHGAGNLALAVGLRRSLRSDLLSTWASRLLGLAAAGILVTGLFPLDPAGSPTTWIGLVHRTAALVSFAIELAAFFLFSAAFVDQSCWSASSGPSFVLSTLAGGALGAFLLAYVVDRRAGLAERLALTSFLAWELWAALRLVRTSGSEANAHRSRGTWRLPLPAFDRADGTPEEFAQGKRQDANRPHA